MNRTFRVGRRSVPILYNNFLLDQSGGELLKRTQALYFQRENNAGGSAALVEALVMDAWER